MLTMKPSADAKRAKITEVLEYIQERLAELEEEKQELSQYQALDKQRRALEYTIYAREQAETNEKLDELEENRRRDLANSEAKREEYADNEAALQVRHVAADKFVDIYISDFSLQNLETQVRDLEQTLGLWENEKSELEAEKEELLKAKAQLELVIKDLEHGQLSKAEYEV